MGRLQIFKGAKAKVHNSILLLAAVVCFVIVVCSLLFFMLFIQLLGLLKDYSNYVLGLLMILKMVTELKPTDTRENFF